MKLRRLLCLAILSVSTAIFAQSTSPSTKWHWEKGTIVVNTPARPAGQQSALRLTTPKLETVRIGFAGLGSRGPWAVNRYCHIPGVQIVALCDYEEGRANGESLVHDYVNPSVTASDADAVIISHSHNPNYGEGFYLATPEMDDASVNMAEKISQNSDFNYYPVTGNETYKSTSAVLVSKPIAQSGYPTFVYEIPEDIWDMTSTEKTKELFDLIANNLN
jgi:hypothetical protein